MHTALQDAAKAPTLGDDVFPLAGEGSFRTWVASPLALAFSYFGGQKPTVCVRHYFAAPIPTSPSAEVVFHHLFALGGKSIRYARELEKANEQNQGEAVRQAYQYMRTRLRSLSSAMSVGRKLQTPLPRHPKAERRVWYRVPLVVYYILYPAEGLGFFYNFEYSPVSGSNPSTRE